VALDIRGTGATAPLDLRGDTPPCQQHQQAVASFTGQL